MILTPEQIEKCDVLPADEIALMAQHRVLYTTLLAYADVVERLTTLEAHLRSDRLRCVLCHSLCPDHDEDCVFLAAKRLRGKE